MGVAHATLGVETTGDALRGAAKVAIVDTHGRVMLEVRGAKVGERLEVPVDAKAESLAVCDGEGMCDAAPDRGGFFVLSLRGRKAPIELHPGIVERRALAALATGQKAPQVCVRVHVGVIDAPRADEVITGRFTAEDGTGTLAQSKLFAAEVAARLAVGGPTREPLAVRVDLDLVRETFALVGGPIARAKDGCFDVDVLPEPLARTPSRFAQAAQGQVPATELASGSWRGATIVPGWSKDRPLPCRVATAGGQLSFAAFELRATATGLDRDRIVLDRSDGSKLWLDFGPLPRGLPGSSLATQLALMFADGRAHVAKVFAGDGTAEAGTVKLTRAGD